MNIVALLFGSPHVRRRLCRASLLACLVLIPAAVALGAAQHTTAVAASVNHGGTLTIATAFEPTTLDPTLGNSDVGAADIEPQIFDQLVELLPGSNNVQPGLAKSWSSTANGLKYTFHLRAAKFSNGDPVTSADVVFSFTRLLNPKIDANYAALLDSFIARVRGPNPSTVVMTLKHPTPAILEFLSFEVPSIVPKAYFEHVGAKGFADHPIGSGPFKLQSWQKGNQMVLVRNPDYWRSGVPYVNGVDVKFVQDDNARLLSLKSGAIDIDDSVAYSDLSSLQGASGVKALIQPVAATFAVMLDQQKVPALRSTAVRQALNYATPKAAINRVVFDNKLRIANSIIPPLEYYDSKIAPYPYDVAKAKALLKSAGVANGFSLTMDVLAGDPSALQTATILQQSWGKIGVHISVQQVPATALLQDQQSGAAGAAIWNPTQWSSDIIAPDEIGGPSGFMGAPLFRSLDGYDNKEMNRLDTEATTTLNPSRRRKLWTQIQRLSLQNPPWVPIGYADSTPAVRSGVTGFQWLPTVRWSLLKVRIGG